MLTAKTVESAHRPIAVGLAGLGRSGWNIHAAALEALADRYQIVAVTDPHDDRMREAQRRFGARPCRSYAEMLADNQVELIVVATPTHLHTAHAIDALRAGRHVVVEKPVATTVADMDAMIAASAEAGRLLAPFQNRRYEPHFQQVRAIVSAGVLGRIVQIRIAMHTFTRRWDWQTLTEFGGGTLNNAGPHFVDMALELLGPEEPRVWCYLDRVLTLGDAEDHAVVLMHAPGAPLIQIEMTSACSMPQDLWLVMGSRGTLRGTVNQLHWQTTDFDELPRPEVQDGAAEGRQYIREKLAWRRETWTLPPKQAGIAWTHRRFYEDLFRTIRMGEPLVITPESVRRQIAVLDQARTFAEKSQLVPL